MSRAAHVLWVRDIADDANPDWTQYRRRFDQLTEREGEALLVLCSGRADRGKALARILGCSAATARNHLYRACTKVGVHNTAALVAVAFNTGWVDEQRTRRQAWKAS